MSRLAVLRSVAPVFTGDGAASVSRWYRGLERFAPLADLAMRLWVASAFFKAGLTKIQSFDSTLLLFRFEYQVPLLSPDWAAYLGTATELSMPVLLALGLLGRFSAGVLFVFNLIAVISYPAIGFFTALDHQAWGIMLLALLLRGPGTISLDYLLHRRFNRWPL